MSSLLIALSWGFLLYGFSSSSIASEGVSLAAKTGLGALLMNSLWDWLVSIPFLLGLVFLTYCYVERKEIKRKFLLRHLKVLSDDEIVDMNLVTRGITVLPPGSKTSELLIEILGPIERLSEGFDKQAILGVARPRDRVALLFLAQLGLLFIGDKNDFKPKVLNLFWLGSRLGLTTEEIIKSTQFPERSKKREWFDEVLDILAEEWPTFSPEKTLPLRELEVSFTPTYTAEDLKQVRAGKGDPAAAIYLNGLDSKVEAERQATIRHVLEMADAQDKRSDIPRALVVRVDELDARDVHAIEEEWRQKLLSVVPDVDSAHERVLRLYFVVVKKDIITRDALERAMGQLIQGLNHHASGRVALAFYTATGAGLDRTLADILIWLLGDGKAFPFSPVFEESLKQDKVYASQA
jgi:hypothetical protein